MSNGKSTWKYNKLLTARRNYFGGGGGAETIDPNMFNSSDTIPYTDATSILDSDPKIKIKPLGNSLDNDNSGVSNASKFGPIAAAAAMIGGDIASTITMAQGEDVKALSKDLQSQIAGQQMAGVDANKDSFDTLTSNWKSNVAINNISKKDLGYTGFGKGLAQNLSSGKVLSSTVGNILRNKVVKKEQNKINNLVADVNAYNERSLVNRAENLINTQGSTLESKYAAFGGELNTQGGDFTNGLLYIDNGGSHESNPYEGVPMGMDHEGTPNLVEEGETIFNDYVFSKRLKVPKAFKKKYKLGGNLSFAEASKKLSKESEERPNDPISKRGLEAMLGELANTQEELKQKMQQRDMMKQMAAMEASGIDPAILMQGMQQEPPEMGMEGMEQPMMAAYGGKVNKFTDKGQMDRRVQSPVQEVPYSYGANSLNNSGTYSNWDTFNYLGTPLRVNNGYASIYTDPEFQAWLRSTEGQAFSKTWWGNKDNARDYYSDVDAYGRKRTKVNTTAPTIDQLLGANSNGLMYDNSYGDAHKFGLAALDEFMKTGKRPTETRRFVRSKDSNGNVIGSDLITDYYDSYDKNGVSWLDSHKGRKEVSRVLRDWDEKEGKYYNDIFYDDPVAPKSHYIVRRDRNGVQIGDQVLYDDAMRDGSLKGFSVHSTGKDKDGNDISYYNMDPEEKKGKYADWLRYAPSISYGIGAINSLVTKPDYSNADAILEATKGAGTYKPVSFKPIGNYLTYRPFDRDFYINKMNAESGAARRSLLNTSGGNRGTAMAGILAADNNALNQIGTLARQAEEYNLAQRQQVEDFNRTTNITNSNGFLQADMANQKALLDSREFSLKGTLAAAEMRQRAKETHDATMSQNISGLFQNLADIGVDEYTSKQRDSYINKSGIPRSFDWTRNSEDNKKNSNTGANGGKLRRKKKGLTI